MYITSIYVHPLKIHGLLHNTPSQPEFRVAAAGSNETLTKVNWLPQQDNLLVVGQRAGKV